MISSATDGIFIDTNVLIYARDERSVDKREVARRWLAQIGADGRARTNLQVLNELTGWILKNEARRPIMEVRSEVDAIRVWGDRPIDADDVDLAWYVRKTLGYQWFDCLLIASACIAGCRVFLTEDMTHGATFEGLTLVNPFRASLDDVLKRT